MRQNMQTTVSRLRSWLADSSGIMKRIESESVHSERDIHRGGVEWAGSLSRLEQRH